MWKKKADLIFSLVCLVVVAIVPLLVSSQYWRGVVIVAMYYCFVAWSWNLLSGFAGQFSLAPAAFAVLGGYVSGILANQGFPIPISIFCGVGMAFLVGLFLGRICLKMKGAYLALTTLGFSEILRITISNEYEITRGDLGLAVPPLHDTGQLLLDYYVFWTILVALHLAFYILTKLPIGLYWQAIGEDEDAARSRGVKVVRYKVIAFSISGAAAGLGGALYVHFVRLATPEIGMMLENGLVIAMCVIGGLGTLTGPIIGSFIVQVTSEYFREIGVYHLIVFALLIILIVRFFREGLAGLVIRFTKGISHG